MIDNVLLYMTLELHWSSDVFTDPVISCSRTSRARPDMARADRGRSGSPKAMVVLVMARVRVVSGMTRPGQTTRDSRQCRTLQRAAVPVPGTAAHNCRTI